MNGDPHVVEVTVENEISPKVVKYSKCMIHIDSINDAFNSNVQVATNDCNDLPPAPPDNDSLNHDDVTSDMLLGIVYTAMILCIVLFL